MKEVNSVLLYVLAEFRFDNLFVILCGICDYCTVVGNYDYNVLIGCFDLFFHPWLCYQYGSIYSFGQGEIQRSHKQDECSSNPV